MAFQDHFSTQSRQYTRFRPKYPEELFEFLASLPAERLRAWDCGTGNGQAAVALAAYFYEVIATDPSADQLSHAQPHRRVQYQCGTAEKSSLSADSINLITVAQALHWFNLEAFYAEVRRIGRAGSVLAAWTYGRAYISRDVDRVIHRLYSEILDKDWPAERTLVETRYATIPFPFEEVSAPPFSIVVEWQLGDLLGYLGTWSAVQRYIGRTGLDPLKLVEADLSNAWGGDQVRQVRWQLDLRIGRVHLR